MPQGGVCYRCARIRSTGVFSWFFLLCIGVCKDCLVLLAFVFLNRLLKIFYGVSILNFLDIFDKGMPLLFSVSGVLGRDAVQVAMLRSFATGGVFVFFGWQAAEVHGGSAIGFLVCSTTAHPHNQRPAYVAAAGLSLQLCKKAHLLAWYSFQYFLSDSLKHSIQFLPFRRARRGIRQAFSQTYHYQANGRAEMAGQQLIEKLRILNCQYN